MADELTQRIISAAIEVHRVLGPGLLESIYEEALVHELRLREIRVERQVQIDVIYKGTRIQGQKLDMLVENEVVVEIKSLRSLPEVAEAQTLSYLKASGLKESTEHTEQDEYALESTFSVTSVSSVAIWVDVLR